MASHEEGGLFLQWPVNVILSKLMSLGILKEGCSASVVVCTVSGQFQVHINYLINTSEDYANYVITSQSHLFEVSSTSVLTQPPWFVYSTRATTLVVVCTLLSAY